MITFAIYGVSLSIYSLLAFFSTASIKDLKLLADLGQKPLYNQ